MMNASEDSPSDLPFVARSTLHTMVDLAMTEAIVKETRRSLMRQLRCVEGRLAALDGLAATTALLQDHGATTALQDHAATTALQEYGAEAESCSPPSWILDRVSREKAENYFRSGKNELSRAVLHNRSFEEANRRRKRDDADTQTTAAAKRPCNTTTVPATKPTVGTMVEILWLYEEEEDQPAVMQPHIGRVQAVFRDGSFRVRYSETDDAAESVHIHRKGCEWKLSALQLNNQGQQPSTDRKTPSTIKSSATRAPLVDANGTTPVPGRQLSSVTPIIMREPVPGEELPVPTFRFAEAAPPFTFASPAAVADCTRSGRSPPNSELGLCRSAAYAARHRPLELMEQSCVLIPFDLRGGKPVEQLQDTEDQMLIFEAEHATEVDTRGKIETTLFSSPAPDPNRARGSMLPLSPSLAAGNVSASAAQLSPPTPPIAAIPAGPLALRMAAVGFTPVGRAIMQQPRSSHVGAAMQRRMKEIGF
jgi:hypothetical protein